jgi:hypothetical protein
MNSKEIIALRVRCIDWEVADIVFFVIDVSKIMTITAVSLASV